MSASAFSEFFAGLQRKHLIEAFNKIESYSEKNQLRSRAYSILEDLCKRRVTTAYYHFKKAGQDHLADKASYCEGAVILFKFFYRRSMQEQSSFFHEGKRLYDDDRKNIPSSAKKAKLIKSPSLVIEISQNFKIAYQILGLLARKKLNDSFR